MVETFDYYYTICIGCYTVTKTLHLPNDLMLYFQTTKAPLFIWVTLTVTIQPGDMIVKMRMAAAWQNVPHQTTST
jgi:hypothetical protein